MSVGSPLLSPEFASLDKEEFSFLSAHATTMDSSSLFDLPYEDENALNPPPKRATFTPTRVKPQPRAWQRKPSTPFAPRSEAQKIWKRVPLQTLTSAINASWRKTTSKGDGIMRPVKRLRIDATEVGEDKENSNYVTAKWDAETYPDGSPRRRAPIKHQELASLPGISSDEQEPFTKMIGLAPLVFETSETMPAEFEQPALNEEVTMQLQSLPAFDPEQETERQSPSASIDHTPTATEQLLDEADSFLRLSPHSSPTTSLPTEMGIALSSPFADSMDQNESMSPALDGSQLPHQTSLQDIKLSFEVGKEEAPEQLQQQQQISEVAYHDPDDTSYLQDFLLRSRAQKAARLQPMQSVDAEVRESPSISSADIVNDTMTLNANAIKQSTPPPSPPTETDLDHDVEDETEAKASSPCRRSSRLTRLPRPQKPSTTLPSSIALRRLNGTEFISMQREAQSLAVTTRGNTRKNRGGGIGVQIRLLQLKSEVEPESEIFRQDQDGLKKGSKAVSWAETLAMYQEYPMPILPSSVETEEPEPVPAAVEEVQEATTEAEPKKPSKRVRNQRKESVGSVNGTPAPKRSIEILLEDAARTTGQSVASMSQQTGKRTRSRTRS